MKNILRLATVIAVFSAVTSAQAVTVKGQASFLGVSTATTNYVDWIYTSDGAIVAPSAAFTYAHGDATAYTASTWYYYYQVENVQDVSIFAFSLNVNPNTILSAGFISGADLDAAPFSHTGVVGDVEAAPWVAGPTDPSGAVFNPGGIAPNVSYDFDSPSNDLTLDEFSTVLFVSCLHPPVFKFSTMQNGESFNGALPVPMDPIPEPMSMLLIASSAIGLYIRKRINR
jgi:hypothetical protein